MESKQKTIVVVAVVTAFSLLGDSMLYIVLPIYWKEVGLDSLWQVGVLLSINRFIRLPFNPLVGWLYQTLPLRTGLMIAVVLGAIATLGYSVAKGFIAWLILRGLWGIAWSFFRIGGLSTVVYYADENGRGKSMGLYNGVYRLGSLFGMLFGGILVPVIGIHYVAGLFGCLAFLGLPLLMIAFRDKNENKQHEYKKQNIILTQTQNASYKASIIISGFFITVFIQGVFIATLSFIMERYYGKEVSVFGVVMSVTFLSGLIQSVRWGWEPYLASRFGHWSDGPKGRLPLYVIALVFVGLTFGMVSMNIWLPMWIVITLGVMLGATALTTLTDTLASDVAKTTNVVSFLTIYSIVLDIGAAVGPVISYVLITVDKGLMYLYWSGTGTFLLLAGFWLVVYVNKKKTSVIEGAYNG
ncbi:MFS transporter [Ectobacillus antri]|uniref:MFS transporter n=2 Tax=Ectobacillus antri TaxID=2486280 RepID=A0ABT6H7K8_9BACI|nr:MFS transporter [Ectobacillus antri]MDG4658239.1 MFS transporter [Ectobacillus antri]MDG5755325.1 MFS transporter [Ectobacillus antri]